MKRAFVAGATGLTGRATVARLVARGWQTTAHVRPDSARRSEWTARFAEMGATADSTPWDEQALTGTLQSLAPTAVFALLGTTRARGRAGDTAGGAPANYETVDYGLTAMLLRAAVASAAGPRFVYLSAAGADGTSAGAYYRARQRAEADIRGSGLPYAMVRPSFIRPAEGERREDARPMEQIGAALGDAVLGVAGALGARKLHARYRMIDNAQLAAAVVAAGEGAAAEEVLEGESLWAAVSRGGGVERR
jgi:uncharacterized protein YbjT (DUF2867 family)